MKKEDIFARNIAFRGAEKQASLSEKSMLIAGVGALGCIVAEILARSGIGTLYLVDRGIIDPPDLNRQTLYSLKDIGRAKTEAAAEKLIAMTGQTRIIPIQASIGDIDISEAIDHCHGVADCLDNFASRFALEDLLAETMFMVHGALQGDYGQLTTLIPGETVSLRDLYGRISEPQGIVPVTPAIVFCIGSLMSQEILKNLLHEPLLKNRIQIVGLSGFVFSSIPVTKTN